MNYSQPLTIALAADAKYAEQVVTLIKSICYHHTNVKFYLLNKDFPYKLQDIIQEQIAPLGCEIVNVHITADLAEFKTAPHITETTFYRFLIPNLPEERILYLDSDIVVNGSLLDFYHTDFDGKPLIAIEDPFLSNEISGHYYTDIERFEGYFNAGVLLINNYYWRVNQITQTLFEKLNSHTGVLYADQDILNIVFNKQWKKADKLYNFQTGVRFAYYERNLNHLADEYEQLNDKEPAIIHYTNREKPWLNHAPILFAEKWWAYYQLTWQAIRDKHLV